MFTYRVITLYARNGGPAIFATLQLKDEDLDVPERLYKQYGSVEAGPWIEADSHPLLEEVDEALSGI